MKSLKDHIAQSQKVWGWVAVVMFVAGLIFTTVSNGSVLERGNPFFYMMFGGAIASWGAYREINKRLEK